MAAMAGSGANRTGNNPALRCHDQHGRHGSTGSHHYIRFARQAFITGTVSSRMRNDDAGVVGHPGNSLCRRPVRSRRRYSVVVRQSAIVSQLRAGRGAGTASLSQDSLGKECVRPKCRCLTSSCLLLLDLKKPIAMSSRAKSTDLAYAEHVTQVGEVLRLRSG